MSSTGAKIFSAILLFVLTMALSCLPYLIIRRGLLSAISSRRKETILAYLNCFAGGVFLATFLCHILAEGSEEFEEYKEKAGWDMEFPLFNIFVVCGFFLVAVIELIAESLMRKSSNHTHSLCDQGLHPVHEITEQTSRLSEQAATGLHSDKNNEALASCANGVRNSSYESSSDPSNSASASSVSHSISHSDEVDHLDNLESHIPKPVGLRAFLLVAALSFHTIFDGLAVGLQTSVSEVWVVFAAIAIHKAVISFCMGFELFQNNLQKPIIAVLCLFIFAVMSPVGVGIGIGLTTGDGHELARLLASSILQGLAGGTFMYVTFLEILSMHIGHHGAGNLFHVGFAFLGFSLMALTKLLDTHH